MDFMRYFATLLCTQRSHINKLNCIKEFIIIEYLSLSLQLTVEYLSILPMALLFSVTLQFLILWLLTLAKMDLV